jgi:PPK2 family polyphosphate:nucleotide phosphotransferase
MLSPWRVSIARSCPPPEEIPVSVDRKKLIDLAHAYRVTKGKKFQLKDFSPGDKAHFKSDEDKGDKDSDALLAAGIEHMSDLQEKLYAQNRWSLLLIFQAIDAAGKDGTIKHVMSGINPQGCSVHSFKAPSPLELDHDFLWRANAALPERGRIGIFNRSYYEEMLVVRVHKEMLRAERIPPSLVTKKIWEQRFEDVRAYERYLTRNGVVIRKFFLHVSKGEQKRRFLARLDDPGKNWKFSAADLKERGYWDEYQDAYEEVIRETARSDAPWYVVPADHKWFTHLVVAGAIVAALDSLGLTMPELTAEQKKQLEEARKLLKK